MKYSEHCSAVAHDGRKARGHPLGCLTVKIIQGIPHQNGVEGVGSVVQVSFQKALCYRTNSSLRRIEWLAAGCLRTRLLRVLIQETMPGSEQVFRVHLEAALDEE